MQAKSALKGAARQVVQVTPKYRARPPKIALQPWTVKRQDEARHLLRSLLRETTYFPDVAARQHLTHQIVSRFQDYAPGSKPVRVIAERRDERMKEARKKLAQLRRANAGELKILTKLLLLAYGRKGKRRHELMECLINSDHAQGDDGKREGAEPLLPSVETEVVNTNGQDTVTEGITSPEKLTLRAPELTDKLKTLLRSQMHASPPELTRTNPKSKAHSMLRPAIPELNTWLRSMPQKRVVNIKEKWYAEMLDRVLPPLPIQEWEQLRDIATGQKAFTGPIPRRTPCSTTDITQVMVEDDISAILRPLQTPPREPIPHPHRFSGRGIQRCWGMVFAQCPHMSYESTIDRWKVEWGSSALKAAKRQRFIGPVDMD